MKYVIVGEGNNDLLIPGLIGNPAEVVTVAQIIQGHRQMIDRAHDAVIDFDKLLRDPSHPSRLLPAYDSGDHLHPNDGGYGTMADAIDLSLFRDDDED